MNIKKFYFLESHEYKKSAITFENSMTLNSWHFLLEKQCFFCEVGSEFLNLASPCIVLFIDLFHTASSTAGVIYHVVECQMVLKDKSETVCGYELVTCF